MSCFYLKKKKKATKTKIKALKPLGSACPCVRIMWGEKELPTLMWRWTEHPQIPGWELQAPC